MTTQNLAGRLIQLMREGKYEQAQRELFSENVISVEPEGTPDRTAKGLNAVLEKGKQFDDTVEAVHSNEVSDALVADKFISCALKTKMTFRGNPEPIEMEEICVYEVADEKIVSEQFFYTPMPELV